MTHSFNRTMLANLGFADPDKRESDHDLACRYVLKQAIRLVEQVFPNRFPAEGNYAWSGDGNLFIARGLMARRISVTRTRQEVPISKGHDRFKTTIGFLDALIELRWKVLLKGSCRWVMRTNALNSEQIQAALGRSDLWENGSNQIDGEWVIEDVEGTLPVEVKITPVSVSEILRQINLYREYTFHTDRWAVATAFPLSADERHTLGEHAIVPVLLGDAFQKWKAEQQTCSQEMEGL